MMKHCILYHIYIYIHNVCLWPMTYESYGTWDFDDIAAMAGRSLSCTSCQEDWHHHTLGRCLHRNILNRFALKHWSSPRFFFHCHFFVSGNSISCNMSRCVQCLHIPQPRHRDRIKGPEGAQHHGAADAQNVGPDDHLQATKAFGQAVGQQRSHRCEEIQGAKDGLGATAARKKSDLKWPKKPRPAVELALNGLLLWKRPGKISPGDFLTQAEKYSGPSVAYGVRYWIDLTVLNISTWSWTVLISMCSSNGWKKGFQDRLSDGHASPNRQNQLNDKHDLEEWHLPGFLVHPHSKT